MGTLLLLTVPVMSGCTSSSQGTDGASGAPTAKQALTSLADLLTHFQENGKKAPTRLADIEPVEPLFQGAYLGLSNGTIVYVWGASIDKSAANIVLAYEKKAETEGGWVLMQDGAVKEMKADEFKTAPKARK